MLRESTAVRALAACFVVIVAASGGCATSTAPVAGTEPAGADVVTFQVDGMACPNCARHIEDELRAVPGVRSASVDFPSRTATVSLDPAAPATMASLDATVAHWKKEHFSATEDPECLDPAKRAELQAAEAGSAPERPTTSKASG